MSVSTTADPPKGVPLYLRRDGDGYIVTDVIGDRYGVGLTPANALREWSCQVADILGVDGPLGEPLKSEVARYRQALEAA